MCNLSKESQEALFNWAELERRAAPLQGRIDEIRRQQKLIEDQIKSELTGVDAGSVETDFATVVFATKKGAVNWPALAKDQRISLDVQEAFRRASTKAFTFKAIEKKDQQEGTGQSQPAAEKPFRGRKAKAKAKTGSVTEATEPAAGANAADDAAERQDDGQMPIFQSVPPAPQPAGPVW